jgi:hypothetical protein
MDESPFFCCVKNSQRFVLIFHLRGFPALCAENDICTLGDSRHMRGENDAFSLLGFEHHHELRKTNKTRRACHFRAFARKSPRVQNANSTQLTIIKITVLFYLFVVFLCLGYN